MDYRTYTPYPYPQQAGYAPYPPYPPPPRGHSPVGVVSFVLAILSVLGLAGIVVASAILAARAQSAGPEPAGPESRQAMLVGLVFLLSMFGAFVGFGLGVGSLFQSGRNRVLGALGLCLNLLILLGVGVLLLAFVAAR